MWENGANIKDCIVLFIWYVVHQIDTLIVFTCKYKWNHHNSFLDSEKKSFSEVFEEINFEAKPIFKDYKLTLKLHK